MRNVTKLQYIFPEMSRQVVERLPRELVEMKYTMLRGSAGKEKENRCSEALGGERKKDVGI